MADANFKNLNSMNDSGTNGNPIGKDGITTLHQTGSLLNDVQMQEALLEEFYPKLTAYKFGQKAVLKDNGGTQVAWLGFEKLDTTNAKVTVEGKAPDPKELVPYEITGTVEQYVLGVTFTDRLLKRGKVFSNDMKNAGDKDRDDNKWVEDNNRFNAMIDKLFIDIIGMEYKTFLNKYKFKVFISPNNKVQFVFNTENISREKFIEVYNHMIQYGKYGEDKLKLV